MEIFRHYYTAAELNTLCFHNQHLNNFGFCNLDGSKINYDWEYNTSLNFRYKLDSKKQTYFVQQVPSQAYYGQHWSRMLGTISFHSSDGQTMGGPWGTPNGSGGCQAAPGTVIFLPLKNNGFFLNIRSASLYSSNIYNIGSSNANDQRDYSFNVSTSTPSLNTKVYCTNTIGYYSSSYPGVLNFIGIPPCKGNLNWTYIFYTVTAYSNNGTMIYRDIIDFGDGKVFDMPFKSNYIRQMNGSTAYTEPTYSNINENICSMIKLPYDNGYIDGVYLLTTAPQQLQDATFFSFDGRNFLNAFDNYVFELPPST